MASLTLEECALLAENVRFQKDPTCGHWVIEVDGDPTFSTERFFKRKLDPRNVQQNEAFWHIVQLQFDDPGKLADIFDLIGSALGRKVDSSLLMNALRPLLFEAAYRYKELCANLLGQTEERRTALGVTLLHCQQLVGFLRLLTLLACEAHTPETAKQGKIWAFIIFLPTYPPLISILYYFVNISRLFFSPLFEIECYFF